MNSGDRDTAAEPLEEIVDDQELETNEPVLNENEVQRLIDLHALYCQAQVDLDTTYYQRTSIITLTQGLLLVAYNGGVKNNVGVAAIMLLALLGASLGVSWFFFEQRNHAFFRGRTALLRLIESTIRKNLTTPSSFVGLWSEVPKWVKMNAEWYERFSAQRVLHTWIPGSFVLVWVGLAAITLLQGGDEGTASETDGTGIEEIQIEQVYDPKSEQPSEQLPPHSGGSTVTLVFSRRKVALHPEH